MVQTVKHLPTMQETHIQSLGQEDLQEKEMATHSSTLAWKIPRMEEGNTPWGHRESDMTEQLHFTSLHLVNSNVLELVSWFWQMYHGRAWVRAM